MKKTFLTITVGLLLCGFSCAQNGPTPKHAWQVTLTFTNTPGAIANCVYRGTTSGSYQMPAINVDASGKCTGPFTSYNDTNVVAGQAYFYAVTAIVPVNGANVESDYSNEAPVVIPANLAPPSALTKSIK